MTADPGDPGEPRTLQDPLAESLRVVDLATDRGLLVRLMGGMAIRAHAPDWPARTRRVEVDLDFATRGKDRGAFYELLAGEGYTADKRHNALFGGKQAYFVDVPRSRPVDVLVDSLEMCHRFEFADRLVEVDPDAARSPSSSCRSSRSSRSTARTCSTRWSCSPSTRSAQDDGAPDARTGQGAINVPRILSFTSNDWGWWRTVTGNLDTLDQYLAVELTPEDLDLNNGRAVLFEPGAQVAALRTAIDDAPKSTRWKLRARVGERQTWYQDPEEMGHN